MTPGALLAYCLAKPGAVETDPWGEGGGVVKVGGKIFAFVGKDRPVLSVKVARSTDEAQEWYDRFPEQVSTMAYIGRYGWITVELSDGVVPDDDARELVDISYTAVVARLPKRLRPLAGGH